MTESSSLAKSQKEWIIHLVSSNGQRKPVGIFNGEFVKSTSTVNWVKGGKATIEVEPTSLSETEYISKLSILHSLHQTIFRIVPNQIGISAAFSGEQGFVYYFDTSSKLRVSGKLRIKYKGESKTYDGRHSLYIDGIVAIAIRNGLVVVGCSRGELYLDETLPSKYRQEMHVQFREDSLQSPIRRAISAPNLQTARRPPMRTTLSEGNSPIVKRKLSISSSRPEAPPGWRRYDQTDSYYLIPETLFDEPSDIEQRQPISERPVRNRSNQHLLRSKDGLRRSDPLKESGFISLQKRSRRPSDPITKRERDSVEEIADKGIRRRIIMRPQENLISDEWVEIRDQFCRPSDGQIPQPIQQQVGQQMFDSGLGNGWVEVRDEFGTYFIPKSLYRPNDGPIERMDPSIEEPEFESRDRLSEPFRAITQSADRLHLFQTVSKATAVSKVPKVRPFAEQSREPQLRPTQGVCVRIPIDGQNKTNAHEYVIYYSNRRQVIRPNATLIGQIEAQPIVHPNYQTKQNEGTIRTVLLNSNDSDILRDAAIVKHSTDLITVSANGNGIVKVYGETSGGFAFGSDSVLRVKGQLIIRSRRRRGGVEDPPIPGISSITVKCGSVSILICGNNHTILLDEGQNNYTLNRIRDGSQLAKYIDRSLSSPHFSPILQTTFGRHDTGYRSGLEALNIANPSIMKTSTPLSSTKKVYDGHYEKVQV